VTYSIDFQQTLKKTYTGTDKASIIKNRTLDLLVQDRVAKLKPLNLLYDHEPNPNHLALNVKAHVKIIYIMFLLNLALRFAGK